MYDGTIPNSQVEESIASYDASYRMNFSNLIKEMKLNTHKCQLNCYENLSFKSLEDSEECARNCFKPLLNTKKSISLLLEQKKDNFERCKSSCESSSKPNWYNYKKVTQCLNQYYQEVSSLKEEVEYIYKGYMKNFEYLLNTDKSQMNSNI
jgi:hypothetical protein